MTVGDKHGVEASHHPLRRKRKPDGRVVDGVRGVLDRRTSARGVEHRVDENPPAGDLQAQRRTANQRDAHRVLRSGSAAPIRGESPAILRRSDEQPHARDSPPQPEEGVWTTGPDGELIPDYDGTFPTINEGEVVHGTVVRVDKDEVLVDIGYKSEGVIPVAELSIRRTVNPADEVSVGEEIDALVMTKEDAEGRLILSKKRARFELAWKRIEAAAETGEPVIGKVIEVVKGGLILDLGVRGFLPASLVDIRRVQDLDEFLGKELRCKVIELNRSRNNVVLSRRAVLEDERKEMRQAILDRLNPGDVVEGHDLEHRRLRRLRRPRRDGRPDPHLRALVVARQPPVGGARDRPDRQGQGARHRPRAPADLARSQADAVRPVAAGARQLRRGRRRRGPRHEGRHVRRVRRDPPRRRGPRPHLRARAASRRESARGRLAGRPGQRADPRGRRRAPPALALAQARRGGRRPVPRADGAESVHTTPDLDLSEESLRRAARRRRAPRTSSRSRGGRPSAR